MARYKLTYFDLAASRGEECRLALHLADVEFVDERIARGTWPTLKPKTPFGGLPLLEVEGKGTLAQSNAILRYVGSTYGLHPADPWEAARHEAVMAVVEELRGHIGPTLRMKDEDEKKRAREELAAGYLAAWGANVEKQIAGPFFAGEKIHVVDLKLFIAVRWLAGGHLDHIPPTLFAGCPKLIGVADAVQAHPDVQRWYATKR
jgi:glutathione S-transferase